MSTAESGPHKRQFEGHINITARHHVAKPGTFGARRAARRRVLRKRPVMARFDTLYGSPAIDRQQHIQGLDPCVHF
jgi:hypothetical protein